MSEAGRGPSPGDLLRWPLALGAEVALLPSLLRDLRHLVRDLARTTGSLADSIERLDEATGLLTRLLLPLEGLDLAGAVARLIRLSDELEQRLGEMAQPVEAALRHVESIERTTSEMRNAAMSVLRRVPGARKALLDEDQGS